MNFFGHAALAASHFGEMLPAPASEQLWVLCAGAMLPDFVGMLRLGRPQLLDPTLSVGVAFHHKTDEAFHELDGFLRLSRQAFAWLSSRSLARGPARAIAHIGVEMLLDEVFAADARAREAYCAALEVPLGDLLLFANPLDAEQLGSLRVALLQRAGAWSVAAPELMAARIRRALASRPRLATGDDQHELLTRWVTEARPQVAAEAPDVFACLRLRLAKFSGAE